MKLSVNLPNLSITRGEIPADGGTPARKRNWARTLKKVLGWGALVVAFFLLFAFIALPTKAVAWRIGHEARKAGYVVDIEDVSVMPWGSATLENVTWTFEPSRPDAPPQQYFMEEVDISISLLSLLAGDLDVEIETEREEGRLWARYAQGSGETRVEIDIDGLPLYDVPKAAQALNVPLYGLLKVTAEITAPEGKFAKAQGRIVVSCSACRAGDGESKLYVPGGSKSLRDGITLPEIDFGTLTGVLVVDKGSATIDEPIATESDDMIMSLTGKLKLKDPFQNSRFDMLMKLELTEEFLDEAERLAFIYRGAGPQAMLDPPERGLGFRLGGPVSRPRFRGVKTQTTAEKLAERRKKRRARDRRRAERRAKRGRKNNDEKPKPKDDAGDEDVRPGLNIRPTDDRDDEDGRDDDEDEDDRRPALPPSEDDGGFDPGDEQPAGDDDDRYARDGVQDDGQDGQDEGQDGDDGEPVDDGQAGEDDVVEIDDDQLQDGAADDGQGDDGQGDDGQGDGGQGDGGQDDGQGGGSGGQGQ